MGNESSRALSKSDRFSAMQSPLRAAAALESAASCAARRHSLSATTSREYCASALAAAPLRRTAASAGAAMHILEAPLLWPCTQLQSDASHFPVTTADSESTTTVGATPAFAPALNESIHARVLGSALSLLLLLRTNVMSKRDFTRWKSHARGGAFIARSDSERIT
jgi:hypothetical protein